MSKVDPITLEVVRNALQSLTDEMYMTIWRTAYSTIVRDSRDCASAILDPQGRLVAQSDSIPALLGNFEFGLRETLKNHIPIEDMEEGDIILQNHPYLLSPTHTPDIVLFTPIFFEGELVAFAASSAHLFWAEMKWIRSSRPGGRETILDSGLKFYPVKFFERGKTNDTVVKTICANISFSDQALGDIRAEVAANNRGVQGMKKLLEKYGKKTTFACIEELMNYTERRVRIELDKIPDGEYHALGYVDMQGPIPWPQEPIRIECKITVKGSDIHYDFTGSSKQSITNCNAVISASASILFYVTRCISDPFVPENDGAHRPITWFFPRGSVFNPIYPAAVFGRHVLYQKAADILLYAFVDVIPEKVNAMSCGATNYQTIRSDTLEFPTFHDMTGGGFGARYNKDGIDAIQIHGSRCVGYPIEVAESFLPVEYNRYELVQDSGGAGKYRGGLGIRRDVTFTGDEGTFLGGFMLSEVMPPKGARGGKDGKPGQKWQNIGTEKQRNVYRINEDVIVKGDVFTLITPGSGGWGDPLERDPQRVLEDVLDEKISLRSAKEDYGVIIDAEILQLDIEETKKLRRKFSIEKRK